MTFETTVCPYPGITPGGANFNTFVMHECKSSIPGVYDEIDVQFEVIDKKVVLKSVKQHGREIIHLLRPKTKEGIIEDCKESLHGQAAQRTGKGKPTK